MSFEAIIVTDLGFGDSGKGTTVDALVRRFESNLVVRHNGGAQAGHNICANGLHHCCSQLGAGSFVHDADTYLSKYMIIHPIGMVKECRKFASTVNSYWEFILNRIFIDPEALVITPYHQIVNQVKETIRGSAKHGSCGLGIGETVSYSLTSKETSIIARDLKNVNSIVDKLYFIRKFYAERYEGLPLVEDPVIQEFVKVSNLTIAPRVVESFDISKYRKPIIFEGAQGILIDEDYGFHPHTTWSHCGPDNALKICESWDLANPYKLGVIRAVPTRHGAGPFPSHYTVSKEFRPFDHNKYDTWQGDVRFGRFDFVLFEYALRFAKCDGLSFTHLDTVKGTNWWEVIHKYLHAADNPECISSDGTKLVACDPYDFKAREALTNYLKTPLLGFYGTKIPTSLITPARLVAEFSKLPVVMESYGTTYNDKIITL